jgi:glycosyltransferase involved in cell wall biosynthesis
MTEIAKPGPALSLVMPCYNEEECLRSTSMALLEAFARENIALQLVLVDNGSHDRTSEVIDALVDEGYPVTKVVVPVNQGYGHGVLEGLRACIAPWVGYLCADGQVPPEGAVGAYRKACSAKEPVLAKVRRKFRKDSWRRKLISICYNLGMPLIFGWMGSIDLNASPKIMARETYLMMNPQSKDWFLDPEIMIRAKYLGLKIVEDNVEGQLRQGGKSNVRFRTILEFVKNIVRYRRGGPISKWRESVRAQHKRDEAAASTPGGVSR